MNMNVFCDRGDLVVVCRDYTTMTILHNILS